MRTQNVFCDRCGAIVTSGVSVVEITATAGLLASKFRPKTDLCADCGEAFVNWLARSPEMGIGVGELEPEHSAQ